MNKVGVYFAYWTNNWKADYKFYIQKAAKLGFDVMELAVGCMVDMSKHELDEIKKISEDEGIELTYCIGFPENKDVSSENSTIRSNGIEFSKKIIETISYMNGTILGGIIYASWPGKAPEDMVDKSPFWERAVESQKQIIKTAENYGVICCYEVVNRFEQFLINTAEEGVKFAKEIDSSNAKLLLDSFHMNIEEDTLGDAIRTAGNYLEHLHIGECNRKVPGKGHMPWDDMVQGLKDINYKGRIVMEPFVKMEPGEVSRDIKVYRNLEQNICEEKLDKDIKEALDFIRRKIK